MVVRHKMQLNFLPVDSGRLAELMMDGWSTHPETAINFPIVWHELLIPPGKEKRIEIVYWVPFDLSSSEPVLELALSSHEPERPDVLSDR